MGQQLIIKDSDGPSGKGMQACLFVVHASHLALFDKHYIEPQEITIEGLEEMAEPV